MNKKYHVTVLYMRITLFSFRNFGHKFLIFYAWHTFSNDWVIPFINLLFLLKLFPNVQASNCMIFSTYFLYLIKTKILEIFCSRICFLFKKKKNKCVGNYKNYSWLYIVLLEVCSRHLSALYIKVHWTFPRFFKRVSRKVMN